ncbi:MAG: helix-turn-helix transcriptional regulator [Lachnospiraceae bacterium]|nr:helix-turn-helix transcriptional regulator [Lachnospiraceae bacterium]
MRYFGIETTKPLQYAVCGQLIDKDGFLHHRRTFEQHVFILVTEGILHITAAGKEYNVGENQYIFLKAGEEHFGHKASKGALSYFWVHIVDDCPVITVEGMAMDGDYSTVDCKDMLCQRIGTTEWVKNEFLYSFPEYGEIMVAHRIQRLFRQLIDLSLEESLYVREMFDYTLSLLLLEVSQEFVHWQKQVREQKAERKNQPLVITEAKEWIRENYSHPFKVTELADKLGYQADYLSTLFKQSMGISIIGYTNKIRIEAAKNLLETEGLPIKVVAYSCGFTDEKYFMKVFKKLEGSTPGQYKNGC